MVTSTTVTVVEVTRFLFFSRFLFGFCAPGSRAGGLFPSCCRLFLRLLEKDEACSVPPVSERAGQIEEACLEQQRLDLRGQRGRNGLRALVSAWFHLFSRVLDTWRKRARAQLVWPAWPEWAEGLVSGRGPPVSDGAGQIEEAC